MSVALSVGILFTLFQNVAWCAVACPPPSIAGSPNSLTTSRPETDATAAIAKCTKPTAPAMKVPSVPNPTAAAAPTAPPVAPAPTWKSVLDPLNAGGWHFIAEGPSENPSAVYASTHNVLHDGNVITAWMRWEFSRPQAEVYPLHYLSAVTREELDCDARSYRRSAVIYYAQNNLREKGPSFTALNDDTTWKPAIPGSEADEMLNWGCATATAKIKTDKSDKPAKTAADAKALATPAVQSSGPVAATGATEVHTAR
jgi:hypothetical protein